MRRVGKTQPIAFALCENELLPCDPRLPTAADAKPLTSQMPFKALVKVEASCVTPVTADAFVIKGGGVSARVWVCDPFARV